MGKKKKKIISFIDWYLPGYKAGGGQRAFSIMVSYLREYFDFYIVTRNTDFQDVNPYDGIKPNKWVERAEGENVWYCTEESISYGLFKKLTKEVKADYAYINGVYSFKFSILPLIILKTTGFKGQIILGTYGMLAPTAINIKKGKKQLFLNTAKLAGLYRNVRFHVTSENEKADVINIFGKKADVFFAPHLPVKELPKLKPIKKAPGELRLVTIARISPEKNTLFALECLKELGNIEGNIAFDIYGPVYDEDYWEKCKKIIEKLPENIKVEYKGVINAKQVFDTLSSYHFLFMPTRGENFGYVILESFMAGRPVIISDKTPWRQLEKDGCGYDLTLKSNTKPFEEILTECLTLKQEQFDDKVKKARKRGEEFLNDKGMVEENIKLFL